MSQPTDIDSDLTSKLAAMYAEAGQSQELGGTMVKRFFKYAAERIKASITENFKNLPSHSVGKAWFRKENSGLNSLDIEGNPIRFKVTGANEEAPFQIVGYFGTTELVPGEGHYEITQPFPFIIHIIITRPASAYRAEFIGLDLGSGVGPESGGGTWVPVD
ncbi:hypothetical protein MSAN_00644900 [Mycena sanguinolenta]|uniref:Uncharacterized protein n=1 Tax=Mycena sanguinolenta TaxID=230812 RepID=A0A8H6Z5B9_9AGAR|nr:hypothetical protein MSAN_00644900 [Mycena sanguinolenta]